MRRTTVTTILILLVLLAGCGRNQASTDLTIGSTPGKALATVWLTPTPPVPQITSEPTFTPAPTLPLPTLAVGQPTLAIGTVGPLQEGGQQATSGTPIAPLGCSTAIPEPFSGPWLGNLSVQEKLGCPIGSAQQRLAAFQAFEHGYMVWVQAEDSIYVLSNTAIQQGQQTDTWWRLEDTWTEADPAIDEGIVPPDGRLQPQRGFGKIWRNNGFVREAVGWALTSEEGYEAIWLTFQHGWMITSPNTEPMFAFIPSDSPPYSTGVHLGPQLSFASPGIPPALP